MWLGTLGMIVILALGMLVPPLAAESIGNTKPFFSAPTRRVPNTLPAPPRHLEPPPALPERRALPLGR